MEKEDLPRDFNQFIKRLIIGLKGIYFRDVIKSSSGYNLIKADGVYLEAIKQIKDSIRKSLSNISYSVKKNYNGRANELSNYLEGIIKTHINNYIKDFNASVPKVGNKQQSAGYPDLIIEFDKKKYIYIEVKTYQKKTILSGLRTFYFKPSDNNKISESCPHILIGFEVESLGRNNRSPFLINDFKIIDLYKLKVNLKPEFNASNPDIYKICDKL